MLSQSLSLPVLQSDHSWLLILAKIPAQHVHAVGHRGRQPAWQPIQLKGHLLQPFINPYPQLFAVPSLAILTNLGRDVLVGIRRQSQLASNALPNRLKLCPLFKQRRAASRYVSCRHDRLPKNAAIIDRRFQPGSRRTIARSEEHTSESSHLGISYA